MKIEYQGKITAADVRKAVFLNYSPTYIWVNIILVGTAIIALIYLLLTKNLPAIPFLAWFAVLALLTMPFWQPFLLAQSANRKGSIYHNPIQGEVDDTGISTQAGETTVKSTWDSYTRYKKGTGILMLYKGKYCVNIFTPHLFASPQEWEALLNLIGAKVPGRKPGDQALRKN